MAEAHAQKHPYHLVDPSPWPAIGAASAFVLALGGIAYMRGASPLLGAWLDAAASPKTSRRELARRVSSKT